MGRKKIFETYFPLVRVTVDSPKVEALAMLTI